MQAPGLLNPPYPNMIGNNLPPQGYMGFPPQQIIDPSTVLWTAISPPAMTSLGYCLNCECQQPLDHYTVTYQKLVIKRTILKCPQLGLCGDGLCGHDERTDNIDSTKINGLSADKVLLNNTQLSRISICIACIM